MPPRNQDRRGGTATRQTERDGTAAKASELAGKATPDLPALIRAELAAAIADLAKEFFKTGRAYKMLGAAGFAGYIALLFMSIAIWAALATVLPTGTAAIIVAFIWAVAATVLYVLGRRMREAPPDPSRAAKTARKRPGKLKGMASDLSGTLKRAVRR
jgi:hypothetical protein